MALGQLDPECQGYFISIFLLPPHFLPLLPTPIPLLLLPCSLDKLSQKEEIMVAGSSRFISSLGWRLSFNIHINPCKSPQAENGRLGHVTGRPIECKGVFLQRKSCGVKGKKW